MTDSPPDPETIRIQDITGQPVGRRWEPVVGSETTALFEYLRSKNLSEDAQIQVRDQAIDILGRCVPPTDPDGQDVGLVIGYVQSGKTMSFTTVTALARDNEYRMIVLLTGTSVPLFNQSKDRLNKDLRLSGLGTPNRGFLMVENPRLSTNGHDEIDKALAAWNGAGTSKGRRRTLIIPVMKNVRHLRNAQAVMSRIKDKLRGVPVLIIDDEADQASLNNQVNKGSESPTYADISQLRGAIPHHSYLQYTATPQAPLLINVIDTLSPNFAQVLTPGDGYTGGVTFFRDRLDLVRTIPEDELPTRDGLPADVPATLKEAMRLFYLGVAAAYATAEMPRGNRSMMVHPAVKRDVHHDYFHWVTAVSKLWTQLIRAPTNDPARSDLLSEFEAQHADLAATLPDLPDFGTLADSLLIALEETHLLEVNARAGSTPAIDWDKHYPWILVGGTALDRGFTVEGLTVTYMPREGGLGNADTIQQRARFFGYKGKFLGYCRVFLPSELLDQYQSYVVHEEDVRSQLVKHIREGKPLNDWKRAFLLDGSLRPTRDAVLNLDYYRTKSFRGRWFTPKSPHRSGEAAKRNREVVKRFLDAHEFAEYKSDPRNSAAQTQLLTQTTLKEAYEQLLVPLAWGLLDDTTNFTGVLLNLQHLLTEDERTGRPDTQCAVYQMKSGSSRKRTLKGDRIPTLFQGKNPSTNYPGDEQIRDGADTIVTVQIHNLELTAQAGGNESEDDPGTPAQVFSNLYTVAVYVPKRHGTYQQEDLDT